MRINLETRSQKNENDAKFSYSEFYVYSIFFELIFLKKSKCY